MANSDDLFLAAPSTEQGETDFGTIEIENNKVSNDGELTFDDDAFLTEAYIPTNGNTVISYRNADDTSGPRARGFHWPISPKRNAAFGTRAEALC